MKKLMLTINCAVLLIAISMVNITEAQTTRSERDSLYSDFLQEMRYIDVRIPENHDPASGVKYTAIYMVDGEWNLENMAFIHRFARDEGFLPHAILIGIPNTYINNVNQRDRDFLPANNVGAFLDFLEYELIPFVEEHFPAGDDRILFGHSYGGTFSMYTLLTRPNLFDSYISSDPPYIWNDNYLVKLAEETFEKNQDLNKALWIAGIEGTYSNMGIDLMDAVLEANAPKNLVWKSIAYPNETHNSVRLKGIYDGLKFIFDGYNAGLEFHPRDGIILKDQPIPIYTFADNPEAVRYTTDGTIPDVSSPKMEQLMQLSEPAVVNMRYITARGVYDRIITGKFEYGNAFSANEKPEGLVQGIWNYSYYEGEWDMLPDFSSLTPAATGYVDKSFNLRMFPRSVNFACLIEGYIEITDEGYHFFIMDSDDGSKLYLDGTLLIDYDGLHGRGNPKSFIVPLEKGFYPIRIEYFQAEQDYGLDFMYLTPVMTEPRPIPVPLDLRFGRK